MVFHCFNKHDKKNLFLDDIVFSNLVTIMHKLKQSVNILTKKYVNECETKKTCTLKQVFFRVAT